MTVVKERIGTGYINEEGDIKPYADIESDMDSPIVSDASIVQGMDNLRRARYIHDIENSDEFLNDARAAREQAVINEGMENPGVVVPLEQHYQDELDLMNLVSGANQRGGKNPSKGGGFEAAHRTHPEILDRYGPQLPNVAEGARRNHRRMVNRDSLDVYHAKELIEAGIGHKEEIEFDARTITVNAYRNRYYGSDEKDRARQARRRYLNKKLAEYASK